MVSAAGKSAVRALDLIEQLDVARQPLRLKDFVEATGAPTSSVAELLKGLSEAGYLAFDAASRTYLPTQRVAALGNWVPTVLLQGGEVARTMQRINDACGEMVFLGTANDLHVQYCEVVRSTHPIQLVAEAGAKRWLARSGLGWVLLAAENDTTIERIYRRSVLASAFERKAWTLDQLMERIGAARRDGIVLSRDTVHAGGSVIANLLPTTWCGRRLAIGVAGPTERVCQAESRLRSMMQDEIGRLARRLRRDEPASA